MILDDLSLKPATESSTVVELLRYWATVAPDRLAYKFLAEGETEAGSLTYRELDLQSQVIAAHLQCWCNPGDRVLLIYPSGLEFITAFLGCLYAGVLAVPAYLPRQNNHLSRLEAIATRTQATLALTTNALVGTLQQRVITNPNLAFLQWLTTDHLPSDRANDWQEPQLTRDTLAFLQYTSGSICQPKGVMVSHGNLLENERLIQTAFASDSESVIVGWLPLFHDMGLVGNVLHPLYLGRPCILMAPEAFLQKPFRWLQAISRYKATISGGPNLAYDWCVRRITAEQLESLDLSHWQVAFSGAEPVRAETLERFASKFQPCGFQRQALYPCYGMAETTLIVSGGLKTKPPVIYAVHGEALEHHRVEPVTPTSPDCKLIVGCGRIWLEQKIMIVDPDNLTLCPPNQVGEIWVAGPSITQGYWQQPLETQATFCAYLADTGEGPFLRTGDLGFLLDGELCVTGRLKDLIILLGRNYYPQDIELTVEQSHPALRPNCGAAFLVESGDREKLVLVQEVERSHWRQLNAEEVIGKIRHAVTEDQGLPIHAVVLVKPTSIPKTSSGKIQRRACRARFLAGSLEVIAEWRSNA